MAADLQTMAARVNLPETVNRPEIARLLGVDERSITNYRQEGIPVRVRGKSVDYPVVQCIAWYIDRERDAARKGKGLNELDQARSRKTLAEAQLAETKLAEAEGNLIPIEMHEKRIGDICDRLRNTLTTVPSKYLSRILTAKIDIEAQAVGEQIRDETLRALQATADAITADDESEVDTTGDAVA